MTPWRIDWARLGSTATLSMVALPPMMQMRLSWADSRNMRSSWLAITPFNAEITAMGTTKDRRAFTLRKREQGKREKRELSRQMTLTFIYFYLFDCHSAISSWQDLQVYDKRQEVSWTKFELNWLIMCLWIHEHACIWQTHLSKATLCLFIAFSVDYIL